jgi:hypothetical protein
MKDNHTQQGESVSNLSTELSQSAIVFTPIAIFDITSNLRTAPSDRFRAVWEEARCGGFLPPSKEGLKM